MPIGDSKGLFYDNEFHQEAYDWIIPEDIDGEMVKSPGQVQQNQQMDNVDMKELGGIDT